MAYKLEWKKSARKEFKKLPKKDRRKIIVSIENLAKAPFEGNFRKLVNYKNAYRIRVGDYRVIYKVFKQLLVIEIVRVGHRKDIYRR